MKNLFTLLFSICILTSVAQNYNMSNVSVTTCGGNFYDTVKKRIGLSFASHVNQAVKSGKLLYRDAYKLTSLKGDTYQTFFTKHF